ncbi:FAD-binding protein [Actinomadura barringtoniae]|uniref:FAD-binding protein n=1 Tax=Actinomadura barringtoniae TaxID=1427535 RepID=A0A939PM96_9ACTN|nr:FAD-binding protein [Actinomadura barringtoniae]MBO2451156.1 FAD-binding protein [Actinomadura barringtoniae]
MRDFGGVTRTPRQVLRPTTTAEVAAHSTAVPHGTRHSNDGRALTTETALDTRGLNAVHDLGEDRITIGAGATWREVLDATLPRGLTPPVLTDYLDLTVGGTISAAGVGGTSHVHGTQAANVIDLEVVTPTGEVLACSPAEHAHLFDAVRAGAGRHGIITRATLRLIPAPTHVTSFDLIYANAAELLAAHRHIHAEHVSSQAKPTGYELKAVYYQDPPPGLGKGEELSYQDFTDRLTPDVETFKTMGEWDRPHPWAQVILPADVAAPFIERTVAATTPADLGISGLILIKRFTPGWVPQLKAPSDAVLLSLLRTASPTATSEADMRKANHAFHTEAAALGAVPYPPPSDNPTH